MEKKQFLMGKSTISMAIFKFAKCQPLPEANQESSAVGIQTSGVPTKTTLWTAGGFPPNFHGKTSPGSLTYGTVLYGFGIYHGVIDSGDDQQMGNPQARWMVCFMENLKIKWMIFDVPPC